MINIYIIIYIMQAGEEKKSSVNASNQEERPEFSETEHHMGQDQSNLGGRSISEGQKPRTLKRR